MTYHVYIMASASHALYTGVTNDIERRVLEHQKSNDGVILSEAKNLSETRRPSFSARYKTRNLVYMEDFGDIRAAIAREKQIKGWLRSKKLALINSANPQWKDLSAEWRTAKGVVPPPANSVIRSSSGGVILSGAKNPSEVFVTDKAAAKNPSEDVVTNKAVAKRPTNRNPRRVSSSQNRDSE